LLAKYNPSIIISYLSEILISSKIYPQYSNSEIVEKFYIYEIVDQISLFKKVIFRGGRYGWGFLPIGAKDLKK
jgi:hypothetical protein